MKDLRETERAYILYSKNVFRYPSCSSLKLLQTGDTTRVTQKNKLHMGFLDLEHVDQENGINVR